MLENKRNRVSERKKQSAVKAHKVLIRVPKEMLIHVPKEMWKGTVFLCKTEHFVPANRLRYHLPPQNHLKCFKKDRRKNVEKLRNELLEMRHSRRKCGG